jgi:hypothetical protein
MSERWYYYDCALKAAYMSQHFGMKFASQFAMILFDVGGVFSEPRVTSPIGKFYLHADSLRLLDPQLGDIVLYGIHNSTYAEELPVSVDTVRWTRQLVDGCIENVIHPEKRHIRQVIQRNGLAFMWPESEAL